MNLNEKRLFKITFCLFLYIISSEARAQDCHRVFNSESSSVVQRLFRLRKMGAGANVGSRTLSRYDTQTATTSNTSSTSGATASKVPHVNPFLAAFKRASSFKFAYPHDLDWAMNILKDLQFRSELDADGRKQYSFHSSNGTIQTSNGTGHEITISKLAAVYASAFREETRKHKVSSDYELARTIKNAAPIMNFSSGQKKLMLSIADIDSKIGDIVPERISDHDEYRQMQAYQPEEFRRYNSLRDSQRVAIDAVALVGGIDVLSALIGRENLFGLYFDLLADLRARTNGERFDSARLTIFSEKQLKELASHVVLNQAAGELATTDFHQPNYEIIIALGLKYLKSDLSQVNPKALRDYVDGQERAKDFIPDAVFDSLRSQGYASGDFRFVMKVLYSKEHNTFDKGLLTFRSSNLEDHFSKRRTKWTLPGFVTPYWDWD